MYTGTLIEDLMATVERAEQRLEQKRVADENAMRYWFEWQGSQTTRERTYAGAA